MAIRLVGTTPPTYTTRPVTIHLWALQHTAIWSSSSEYYCYAGGFKQTHGIATTGTDVASIYDTAGDDELFGTPTETYLENSSGLYVFAGNFDYNYAYASTGTDTGTLLDSPGDDSLVASGTFASLEGPGYYTKLDGCDKVTAQSGSGGVDHKYVSTVDYALELLGPWT